MVHFGGLWSKRSAHRYPARPAISFLLPQPVFVPDKHATATLTLDGVTAIHCIDFDMMPAIIFDLEITQVEENYRIEWSASYGVAGFIIAKHVRINLAPGKPD